MTALSLQVQAVGLSAPGLENWAQARQTLQGEAGYRGAADYKFPAPSKLPANERRRATPLTRLAFAACEDALQSLAEPLPSMRSVFASCSGDMDVINSICRGLCANPIALSPMQFHNSVHNAPAGYWSIAGSDHSASTSISAYDASFAAGLLESALQLHDDPSQALLLVCYDVATPAPLHAARPVSLPFASAWLLGANMRQKPLAQLQLRSEPGDLAETVLEGELEKLRLQNPAARALPLLQLLAQGQTGELILGGKRSALRVTVAAS